MTSVNRTVLLHDSRRFPTLTDWLMFVRCAGRLLVLIVCRSVDLRGVWLLIFFGIRLFVFFPVGIDATRLAGAASAVCNSDCRAAVRHCYRYAKVLRYTGGTASERTSECTSIIIMIF